MSNNVFKRVEKKFLTDDYTLALFLKEIRNHLIEDKYSNYSICNIYYDTSDNLLIRRSIEKPAYKEKLRVRSYGVPLKDDTVFIEKKMKFNGTVYKRRIKASAKQSADYLNYKIPCPENSQIGKEIDYFINSYNLSPKLFIAYDRHAFAAKEDSDLRITIDKNIRSRDYNLSLMDGDYGDHLLPQDRRLIEIKCGNAFPLWLTNALSKYKLYPSSFSKYGNIYKKNFLKENILSPNHIYKVTELREVI